jgi:hypothetical protein
MQVFSTLGTDIARAWSRHDFDEESFPLLARDHLAAARPHEQVSAWDVLQWIASTDSIVPQPNLDVPFGQPPLTVYWHPRFYIELLFWATSTTSIHQHSTCGAFGLLAGSSLNSVYHFTPRRRVNSSLLLGDVALTGANLLVPGDVEPIDPGNRLIHSVFHLDFPSVSIVVRRQSYLEAGPTYEYHPPHVCAQAFAPSPVLKRKLQALELVALVRPDQREAMALRILDGETFYGAFRLLQQEIRRGDDAVFAALLARTFERHGDDARLLGPSLRAQRAVLTLTEARQRIVEPDQRFFLGLLMNLPDHASISRLIAARYPGAAIDDAIIGWLRGLGPTGTLGLEIDDLNEAIVRGLLGGGSDDDVLRRIGEQYEAGSIGDQEADLREHIGRVRALRCLAPLFTGNRRPS